MVSPESEVEIFKRERGGGMHQRGRTVQSIRMAEDARGVRDLAFVQGTSETRGNSSSG